jgi:hypothetical protein
MVAGESIGKQHSAGARDSHSTRTRSFSETKSVKVSFVKDETSEAEATARPIRPSATVVKVRMLRYCSLQLSSGA